LHQTDDKAVVEVVAESAMPAARMGLPSATRVLFGPFELSTAERSLKKAGEVVSVGGRAFDILTVLIDRAGEVVSKDELIAKAWPDVTVEEGSLRVHLSALRKALGDGQFRTKYIENVQGRGYRFVVPIKRQADDHDQGNTSSGVSNLPPPLSRMIGRDDAVRDIGTMLKSQRLTTILGAGGIGKTTLALAVGHAALADFAGQVFLVDLSAVRDKEQVTSAIATAIGLDPLFVDPEEALLRSLSRRKALIILDSCEHLVKTTAEIADCMFQRAPGISMLATSREALQIAGEQVFRLRSLDCPPERLGQTAAEVLSYPAARLFVERVGARANDFSLSDDDASIVAKICRKLDGIALAIELAAGRAAIFGVRDTIARLDSRLDLLKFGRRTANPRHQTLRATLDWSHDHLSEGEQVVLRRVAIFAGHFTLEAALAVAAEEGMGEPTVADAVGSLVEKSLIGVRIDSRGTFYRLLDTTRSYALEKLIAGGEHESIAARHADFLIQLLESNRVNLFELRGSDLPADSVRDCLGNLRAALEWSFGPAGSDRVALRLAAASAQLFLAMSLLPECRSWMEKAIGRMAADCDARQQMEIHASLALSLMFTEGNSERVRDAFNRALTLADEHEDAYQQLRLLSGLSMYCHRRIDVAGSLELALRGHAVARKTGSPDDVAIADAMLGAAYYMRGEQRRAQDHLERALQSAPPFRRFNATQYLFDLRTTSLFNLTRSYWFTGNLDRAVGYAKMTIEEAERSDHPIALSRALILTMPFYFWIDHLQQVGQNLSRLELTAEKHSLMPFRAVALGLRGRYLIRVGQTIDGMRHLQDSLEKLRSLRYEMLVTDFISELAMSLAKQNERTKALALVEESIAAQLAAKRPLHLPALFLAKGLVFLHGEPPENGSAKECLEEAMTLAAQQSALSFELRAGLELARLWIDQSQSQRAHDLIAPIYHRFTEGRATADLILAKRMLEKTGAPTRQAGHKAAQSSSR
jgi:predicted ATPase/DNA-binding winged helix-turn-helix (wHTH) protein